MYERFFLTSWNVSSVYVCLTISSLIFSFIYTISLLSSGQIRVHSLIKNNSPCNTLPGQELSPKHCMCIRLKHTVQNVSGNKFHLFYGDFVIKLLPLIYPSNFTTSDVCLLDTVFTLFLPLPVSGIQVPTNRHLRTGSRI